MGSSLNGWKGWTVAGQLVVISATADIPSPYRPRQARADLVKQALSMVRPWRGSEGSIQTFTLEGKTFPLVVVPRQGLMPVWFKHIGHHARHVQLSPFVELKRPLTTTQLTVELTGTAGRPRLVRAYPGDYMPPLPWMGSAQHAPGGVARALEYWREHAYVLSGTNTVPGSGTGRRAPAWFTTR